MPGRDRGIGLSLCVALLVSGCGKPALELPADPEQRAIACHAASIVRMGSVDTRVTAAQANEAAHFLLLGASASGTAEPSTLKRLAEGAAPVQERIRAAGNAAAYTAPCADAFPATKAGAFKQLPPDDRNTRMLCFTLSTALLQTYQTSGIASDALSAAVVRLNERLDARLLAEIRSEGEPNVAELSGRAMRGLALAVALGPISDVVKACADRYAPAG